MLYDLAQDDGTLQAKLSAERSRLALDVYVSGNGGEVIQGSKNGASYTKNMSVTKGERLRVLDVAIRHIAAGVRPTSSVRVTF